MPAFIAEQPTCFSRLQLRPNVVAGMDKWTVRTCTTRRPPTNVIEMTSLSAKQIGSSTARVTEWQELQLQLRRRRRRQRTRGLPTKFDEMKHAEMRL
jgi:hypothetical protein